MEVIEDLLDLRQEYDDSIVSQILKDRYHVKRVYTQIGDGTILFANPNEVLPIYDDAVQSQYRQVTDKKSAHIYSIAQQALTNIENGSLHESIVFCGESGSGKSSNFFHTLKYLCNNDNSKISVQQVDALREIIQNFGSAKTLKSELSTRCGYSIDLHYKANTVCGFTIAQALPLDLNLLVEQRKGDQNFNIFYRICAFEEAEKYGLNGPNKYFYLDQGKSNINMKYEGENFTKLSVALTTIGFSTDQKELIFRTLAAILHVGNIYFTTFKTTSNVTLAAVANEAELQWIAFLLNTDIGHIRRIFCDKHLTSDESEHATVLKNIDTGLDVRDAFAKFLYNHLCGWIFSRISLFFQFSEQSRTISLVDAPGFEKYHNNGFGQMLVNAGNESLENVFLHKIFGDMWRSDESSNEYAKSSALVNNQNVINLLTKSPSGIIPLLEDECKFPKGSDENYLQRCNINNLDKIVYLKARTKERLEFGVKHYAGMAWYDVDGFLSRNRCAVLPSFYEVLRHCKDASMVSLYEYARGRNPNGENEVHYIASVLVQHAAELNKRLQESNCLFVRCIRTNSQHQPGHFDTATVSRQVKYLSIVEQCRALLHCCVRKLSFEEFAQKFRCLLTDDATRGQTPFQITRSVLETQGEQVQSEYKIDMEHVFLTENLWKQLQEVQRFTHNFAAMIIQRNWRKWSKQLKYRQRKNAVIKLQAVFRGWRDRKKVSLMKDGLLKCITQTAPNRSFNCQKSNGTISDVEFMKATSVCVDLALPLPLQKLIKDAAITKVETKQITDYIPLRKAEPNPIIVDTPISIEEFAAKSLKYHVLGKFRAPITTPFLSKNTDDEYEEAIHIFKLILRYTTDASLNENQLVILAKYIIQLGIDNANQRDEIYVQLCNQTYKCSDSDGKRAWDLLLLATNSFPPGVRIFPMLYHYFGSQQPPLSTLLMDALLRPIKGTYGKGRLHAPTILEQASICRRQPTVMEFNLSNGEKYAAEVDSWISAEECVQKVLRHKGIGDSCGWCVELDYAGEIAHLSGNHSLFDAIAQKEKSHIEARENSPFVFFDIKPMLRFIQNDNGHHSKGKYYDTNCKSDIMQSPQDIFSSAFQKYYNQADEYGSKYRLLQGSPLKNSPAGKSSESQTRNMNFISPRRQNANCMSRITEEDFPMVSRENTLKGFPMREYNDVKQTMSRGFAPVFEREKSNEDRSRCQFDPKLLDVITSSIKGGGDYEADPKQIYHNSDRHHFSGKDCYMDSDRNTENMDLPYDPRIFMRSAASRYNVDERFPVSHHKETDPYKTEPRYKPNDDVRIYHPVYTNGGNYGLSPSPCHNNSMSNVSKLNPNYYLVERGRECDSLASRYLDEEGDEEENEACNEWVHESEIPLVGSNYMSLDKHYVPVKNFKEQNSKAETYKVTKKVPAVKYAAQPYDITVRKEIFGIDEILDDGQEIDLIFSQIVSDSRKVYPHRMRKYEIVSLNEILLSNSISAHLAQLTNEIPTAVKAQIIDAVRKWPLYFCRMYAVIEERPNDRVPLFIGISETGIRLISYNSANEQDPMIIQDHFEYSDISELSIENGKSLRLITRQNISVLITSATQASEIKKCIEEYIYGCPSEKKRFVIAISDYSTNKPNILSFERGNFIEIVRNPDTESPVGNWTYGKLDNNFGWFPIDYVQPVADDQYDPEDNYTIRDDFYGQMMQSKLEPLYTNNYYDERQSLYGYNGDANRYTMAEFAALYFRRSKHFAGDTFSLQRKKKEWTWKDITDKIKFSSRPINHSLLNLQSSEADKMAQDAFLCIMRYMGDEGLKRGQSYTDCIYELLSLCHRYVPLRDEIYCQLIKQVTSNKSQNPESLLRGWRLFSIVTAYFACSETLRPYLVKYLDDIAEDNRRVFYGLANQCRLHLAQTFRYGGRRFILGAAEVEATTNGKNIRRQVYHLPGGHRKIIYTRPITVAEEIVQELCLDMNVRSNEEQQEYSLCYVLEEDNSMKFLNNDEYIMDVITELDSRKEEYTFILTRIVFIHPLRQDSDLYSDALFFQIMPNYIAGLLNSLNKGMVSAAVLNDITRLGALLLLSDPAFNVATREHGISTSSISSLVPKTILQFANISVEQWVDRIQSKCEELSNDYTPILARQQFLETVEKWQLFGAAFFFVKRTVTKRNEHLDCVLSINKGGIRVLANKTHEILSEYPLEEIASTNKYSLSERQFFEIHLTNLASQKYGYDVITIETDLGVEIARLLGQYLYLSKESMKEPIYIANVQK